LNQHNSFEEFTAVRVQSEDPFPRVNNARNDVPASVERGAGGREQSVTAHEWDRCSDPRATLEFLRTTGRATNRKLRLFAVACCRRIYRRLGGGDKTAVNVVEQCADGLLNETHVQAALSRVEFRAVRALCELILTERDAIGCAARVAEEAVVLPYGHEFLDLMISVDTLRDWDYSEQCRLGRCIFGNPFRRVTFDSAWLGGNVGGLARLAQAAYDKRDLPEGRLDESRMAVLAGATAEAGCPDLDFLGHLQSPGPHVRAGAGPPWKVFGAALSRPRQGVVVAAQVVAPGIRVVRPSAGGRE
jgi:hypothetical protein